MMDNNNGNGKGNGRLPVKPETDAEVEQREIEHRAIWERTHFTIQETYLKIFKETGIVPSMRKVSEVSGVSLASIYRHYREMRIEDITEYHKIRADRILFALASAGEKGNERAAKLYFQLVWGYREEIGVRIGGTLKHLMKVDWKTVPTDSLRRIRSGESPEKVLGELEN